MIAASTTANGGVTVSQPISTTTVTSAATAASVSTATSGGLPIPDLSALNKMTIPPKPPITPKPVTGNKLQEAVIRLEQEVARLSSEAAAKDEKMKKMEERISQLEYDQIKNQSYFIVHSRTTQLLQQRISHLEQYTRRYSVTVKGLERPPGYERPESLTEEVKKIVESSNSVPFTEVDKFHRNGRRTDKERDIIIRFKSHSAKELFYKSRKTITNKKLKVQPSLSPERKRLLEASREMLEAYHSDCDEYPNPPHFVLPDEHGNLLLKMKKKTKHGLFLRFDSLQELHTLISKHNSYIDADFAYEEEMEKIAGLY